MWHNFGSAPLVLGSCVKDLLLRDVDAYTVEKGVTLQAKDVACSNDLPSCRPW